MCSTSDRSPCCRPACRRHRDDDGGAYERIGPDGQNVNKVSSAVALRFNLVANTSIPDYARGKLKRLAGRRLSLDGVIVIQADRFRSQEQNRSDARGRLKDLIAEALERPKPRIKTKPSHGAKERRVDAKTTRGHVKKLRSRKVEMD
jgi:ribosome-associated protein